MEVEEGVIDAVDESRGRFVVHFASGSYAVFEMFRQPGQEKGAARIAVGETVRAAAASTGKIVVLNMSRKVPLLVNGLSGPQSRNECLRAMAE
ncbi:hypothetical protein [Pandoraea anhela]|uniref:Uncharacterized protein n=1 Tax=Pandoraea anhela TaxID=2508295 RepID=A0A5E4Z0X2_9BURK|nr:hypothetical protein [Pandoraea anhela]VVE54245.1 hypothetical protein PAN31108_04918 [Pandoraea anhela]